MSYMTLQEKLEFAARYAQRFANVNQTNALRIEAYPHVEGDGFAEHEQAYEVSAYLGSGFDGSFTAKTLEAAVDGFLARIREQLLKGAECDSREAKSREGAAEWKRQEAADLEAAIGK